MHYPDHWIYRHNYTQWDCIIGESIWAEPEPIPQTYAEEITAMKTWVSARLTWIDGNLPGNCANDVLSINDHSIAKGSRSVIGRFNLLGQPVKVIFVEFS